MKRFLAIAATATTLLAAGAAQAGSVNWSIGLDLPHVATVVSGGPGYHGGPTYVAPHRVYGPVVPAYYEPGYALPAPVAYGPRFHHPHPRIWLPPLPHHRVHAPHWRGQDRQHHRFRGDDRQHHQFRGHDRQRHQFRGHERQQHQFRGQDRRHQEGRGGHDRKRDGRGDRRD